MNSCSNPGRKPVRFPVRRIWAIALTCFMSFPDMLIKGRDGVLSLYLNPVKPFLGLMELSPEGHPSGAEKPDTDGPQPGHTLYTTDPDVPQHDVRTVAPGADVRVGGSLWCF